MSKKKPDANSPLSNAVLQLQRVLTRSTSTVTQRPASPINTENPQQRSRQQSLPRINRFHTTPTHNTQAFNTHAQVMQQARQQLDQSQNPSTLIRQANAQIQRTEKAARRTPHPEQPDFRTRNDGFFKRSISQMQQTEQRILNTTGAIFAKRDERLKQEAEALKASRAYDRLKDAYEKAKKIAAERKEKEAEEERLYQKALEKYKADQERRQKRAEERVKQREHRIEEQHRKADLLQHGESTQPLTHRSDPERNDNQAGCSKDHLRAQKQHLRDPYKEESPRTRHRRT